MYTFSPFIFSLYNIFIMQETHTNQLAGYEYDEMYISAIHFSENKLFVTDYFPQSLVLKFWLNDFLLKLDVIII